MCKHDLLGVASCAIAKGGFSALRTHKAVDMLRTLQVTLEFGSKSD